MEETIAKRPQREQLHEEKQEKPYLKLRNILNIVFMVGALTGVCLYFFSNETIGTYVILVSMVFKMAEAALRMFKI